MSVGKEAGMPRRNLAPEDRPPAGVGRVSDQSLALIEKFRREGVDVVADQYPYDRAATNLGIRLPSVGARRRQNQTAPCRSGHAPKDRGRNEAESRRDGRARLRVCDGGAIHAGHLVRRQNDSGSLRHEGPLAGPGRADRNHFRPDGRGRRLDDLPPDERTGYRAHHAVPVHRDRERWRRHRNGVPAIRTRVPMAPTPGCLANMFDRAASLRWKTPSAA